MPFDPLFQPNANVFPVLELTGYKQTSPADRRYNCIAWAVGERESRSFWWPGPPPDGKWPAGIPRNDLIETFHAAFATEGYEVCSDGDLEVGFEKIAIYAIDGRVKHAARQLKTGEWTSKLGRNADITHSLDGLVGFSKNGYGSVVGFMRRPATSTLPILSQNPANRVP